VLADCAQVAAGELLHPVHARARDVRHEPGRLVERQFHEPGRDLTGIDRLEPGASPERHHRHLRHLAQQHQDPVVELGGAQRGPGHAGVGDDALGVAFRGEVAVHGSVDAADDRDPVGADDRDEHQVPDACPGGRSCQVPSHVVVALGSSGAVHDRLDARHRGIDPIAGPDVSGHVLDAVDGLAPVPAEQADLAARVLQERQHETPERARAAREQYG
jgi:hypothetical protein